MNPAGVFRLPGSKAGPGRSYPKDGPAHKAGKLLKSIFKSMQLQVNMNIEEKDHEILINLEGNELGILIGRRGETLDALQYLVSLAVNKNTETRKKIIIDVEGYRKRREETLQKLALKLADKAKQKRAERGPGTDDFPGKAHYSHGFTGA